MSNQIKERLLREAILTGQQGAVATSDIVEIFLKPETYNKLYCGWGSGKQPKKMILTADEIQSISYAITAMANTLMDASRHFPKQIKRVGE